MTIACILYFLVFFGTIFSRQKEEAVLQLPVSEILHDEKRIPLFDSFKPWLVTMAVILALAYVPAFMDASKNPGPGAPRFQPDNPVPVETEKMPSASKQGTSIITVKKGSPITIR